MADFGRTRKNFSDIFDGFLFILCLDLWSHEIYLPLPLFSHHENGFSSALFPRKKGQIWWAISHQGQRTFWFSFVLLSVFNSGHQATQLFWDKKKDLPIMTPFVDETVIYQCLCLSIMIILSKQNVATLAHQSLKKIQIAIRMKIFFACPFFGWAKNICLLQL